MKMLYQLMVMAAFVALGICVCAGTFVVSPKQEQKKVSIDECCDEIGFCLELQSHILQREGKVQELIIAHFRDAAEGDKKTVLTRSTSLELRDYYAKLEKHNENRKAYLQELDEYMRYLQETEKKHIKSGIRKIVRD